nr:hypothetical protein [Micromonospora sp. DSM 115978]
GTRPAPSRTATPNPPGPQAASSRTRPAGRLEHLLVTVLPVLLAAGAFAVAFVHVHDVAAWAGQPDWAAWLVAVSVELMALASILEIRHRHQHHAGVRWPVLTLAAGIGMSGAANLAASGANAFTSPPGPWTTVMALWPVAAFALVAGLKATRPTSTTSTDRPTQTEPAPNLPAPLVAAARDVATDLRAQGRPVTQTALAKGIRARGLTCSSRRAALLLAMIRSAPPAPKTEQGLP